MGESGQSAFATLISGFGPVQSVLLFVGFVVFCVGLSKGFTFDNRYLMIGVGLMFAGIAGHYWPEWRKAGLYSGDPAKLDWGKIILATIASALSISAFVQAYRSSAGTIP